MLVDLGKSGGNENYAIEWLCACSLFAGLALSGAIHGELPPIGILRLVLCRLADRSPLSTRYSFDVVTATEEAIFRDGEQRLQLAALARWVRAAPKTILSDDMVLTVASGKQVPLEPQIFAELSAMGRWDETRR